MAQPLIKTSCRELAIAGGPKAFATTLAVGAPNIGNRESFRQRLDTMLDSGQLSNHGPLVREFEARICEVTGAAHCIACCNATVGLELAIEGLGVTGSAIVPSFTFIATAHALERCNVRPIFADVDPLTHNLDPARLADLIEADTSAILGVHLWGRPCPVDDLEAIAREHGLALIYDAAHAFGATSGGRSVGNFGDAEVFSFHATKAINSFEGGAITTNDDALARRLREMVNFGISSAGQVARWGTNAKQSEAHAAMGLTSLEAMEPIFAHNRANHLAYRKGLAEVEGVSLLPMTEGEWSNWQYVVIEVDACAFGISRDELLAVLEAENVMAKRYFHPGCHRSEPYANRERGTLQLPVTERLCEDVLCLPTGLAVSPTDVAAICRIIELAPAYRPPTP